MSQAGFESVIHNIFFWIIWFFELVGAIIIIIGALVCIFKYLQSLIQKKKIPLKLLLANQLALGLEFMLAAEILKTVITPKDSANDIMILSAVVLLRVVLTLLLHWELKNEEKVMEVSEKKTKRLTNEVKKDA